MILRNDQQSHSKENNATNATHLIDAEKLLADQLAEASPDLLRGLLSVFILS